jgi:hypothetical protein
MRAKRIKARLSAHFVENTGNVQVVYYCWALPADAQSYERMVGQMAKAVCVSIGANPRWISDDDLAIARAALRAIGITNPAKKGRK